METDSVSETIKAWIAFDDEERRLRAEIKKSNEQKVLLSKKILEFMRSNEVDKFALEGTGAGTLTRSVRTTRPPVKRANIRKQLFVHFADQPQRVTEFLRELEGAPATEGAPAPANVKKTEVLTRVVPREKKI
jgi:hypothetical protein